MLDWPIFLYVSGSSYVLIFDDLLVRCSVFLYVIVLVASFTSSEFGWLVPWFMIRATGAVVIVNRFFSSLHVFYWIMECRSLSFAFFFRNCSSNNCWWLNFFCNISSTVLLDCLFSGMVCGCDFANSDKIFNSLHYSVTFLFTNIIRKSSLPITAPKCLVPSFLTFILVSLNKRFQLFQCIFNIWFLRTSQDLL